MNETELEPSPANDPQPIPVDAPNVEPFVVTPAPLDGPEVPCQSAEPIPAWFEQLAGRLDRIESGLISKSTSDVDRDRLFKEMHSQLQEAQSGVHWKILRTVLMDLVRLYDDLDRASNTVESPGGIGGIPSTAAISEFRQDVEDILYRQGFTPFTVEGDRFDGRRQQPVSTVEAPTPEQVGTIASRVAVGFESEDRILRQEKVVVYGPRTSG